MIIPALFLATTIAKDDFTVPVEASSEFRKLALSIEDALVEKNFEKGSKLIAQLPRTSASIRVDLSKVPAAQRPAFQSAVTNSAKTWQTALGGTATFSPSASQTADVNFVFGPAYIPTWKWTPNSSPPILTATLPSIAESATDNCRLSFAKYLGLSSISKGSILSAKDISAAKKVLNLSRLLQESIQSMAPDYRVPVGASSEFHHLVIDIEKALSSQDFATADKLSAMLPRSSINWSFDNTKLNADQKEEFSKAAEAALNAWQKGLGSEVAFKKVAKGKADIAITFEPVLAKISGTKEVAGAAFFLGTDSTQPSIETVIGLKRGPRLESVLAREVFNECVFTFGRYLGLAPSPLLGSAMGRIEGQMGNSNGVSQQDIGSVRKILTLSDQLRRAVQKRQAIESRQPILSIDKTSLEFVSQYQGDVGKATILVTNTGTSTLELDLKGDCGCITGDVQATLLPGKSAILTGFYNTTELSGDVHHNLILKTNDADKPLLVIPCSITVNARAEVVYSGSNTAFMDDADRTFTFYVNSVESKIFKVIEAAVMGMQMTAKAEPFEGEVSNFQKSGQKQMVRGYKVTVDTSGVPAAAFFGRSSAMVYLRTDNPKIGIVKAQIFVQKGIVSLPESVYLGSPQGAADSTFVLLRLGRPFDIKKVTSDSKNLTFEITPNAVTNPSGYTIRVIYDGKVPGHHLKGTITVETSDAKQPVIKLPFQTSQI
jgi:Protein of unknown function (DUF1573)